MIVMIADQQILSARQVCQNCVMSDQSGLPRWHDSKLGCGKRRSPSVPGGKSRSPRGFVPQGASVEVIQSLQRSKQAQVYECQMGFNVTWIN
ncbi:hypothetical protein C7B62_05430 [Pleurocapsa sp. CCALA 161]|uniref:hypothetical protein n=1 Tax=Pleurocapsa sp. CCALA 161 TaxID=2107688 RepID=UPI000D05B341|nr:hypothetical protein [Pleurocapsa sp. CCALA 161]PSB11457.1 hypothetical protein C7B62_05430 [Pleurocapsa sp. CCALA 161]